MVDINNEENNLLKHIFNMTTITINMIIHYV